MRAGKRGGAFDELTAAELAGLHIRLAGYVFDGQMHHTTVTENIQRGAGNKRGLEGLNELHQLRGENWLWFNSIKAKQYPTKAPMEKGGASIFAACAVSHLMLVSRAHSR